jgi:GMP synthase (glutamine-hydrolysing)
MSANARDDAHWRPTAAWCRVPVLSTMPRTAMKPVLVLQQQRNDGPAYLATWLAGKGVALDLRCAEDGDALPPTMADHGALAVLGGAMSANDDLPALRQAERLILDAMARGRPVIGHCLGGQLMARALGAGVAASPAPEIGWHRVDWLPAARDWFGTGDGVAVFQWHFDAFDLPPGAQCLGRSVACPNQAFAIGPHLAMQFHVELDAAKLGVWSAEREPRYVQAIVSHPSLVQTPAQMCAQAALRLAAQQAIADLAYARWLGVAGVA